MIRPKKKEVWECPWCYKRHNTEKTARNCFMEHVRDRCVNRDWQNGVNLGNIQKIYKMVFWKLTEKQKHITKDSCFVISYLQCCKMPAYKIKDISGCGEITVGGTGSWNGYYQSRVRLDNLKDPCPKEQLFIDPRA